MKKFKKGDYIECVDKKTKHVIESLETIENITVIFTEDSKCFPVEKIKKSDRSIVGSFFAKILRGEQVTKEEHDITIDRLSQLNVVYIDRS
jgi:hypothetical protein